MNRIRRFIGSLLVVMLLTACSPVEQVVVKSHV